MLGEAPIRDIRCCPEKSRDSNGSTEIIAKVIFNVADC